MIAIVLPTIAGRETDLARCVEAYAATTFDHEQNTSLIIEQDHPSCGSAWVAGAEKAAAQGFDYLHFGADDLQPHEDWLDAALEAVDSGFIPAPLVYHADGQLDSAGLEHFTQYRGGHEDWQMVHGTTVPFVSRRMWADIGPAVSDVMRRIHYATDLLVSTAGRYFGFETVIRTGMRFTHHVAEAGRNYARAPDDLREYMEWERALSASISAI